MLLQILVVDCGDLSPVENGLPSVGNTTTVGSLKKFRCKKCFALHGPRSLLCQDNGSWNGSIPTCKRKAINCILQVMG